MQTKYEQFVIKMANVIKQSGINDCRVFVIAYITHIAFGQDPSLCVFPQNHMRNHLCTCFDEQKMVPFPIVRERRSLPEKPIQVNVYCYCRCPDNLDATMIFQLTT